MLKKVWHIVCISYVRTAFQIYSGLIVQKLQKDFLELSLQESLFPVF